MATHELNSGAHGGPLTAASYLFGAVTGAIDGTPDVFSPLLVYDFIKTRTDTLYPTQQQLANLDANALQKSAGHWDGEGLKATGFADAVASTDLATYGQLQTAIITGVFDVPSLGAIGSIDAAADLLLIYDTSLAAYKKTTPADLLAGIDADLADIAALTPADGAFIVGDGAEWGAESGATARTSLGLGTGDSPQFTAVSIGDADTTLTRVSAGVVAVEGSNILLASGLGSITQAWDADLDTWATKTAPSGTVVGTSDSQTLTNKTVALDTNTVSGTTAQFNTALSDGDFATLAGSEALTNKTFDLTSNTLVGSVAEFNAALESADFYTTGGTDVAIADGGTGASTAAAGFDALAPTTTRGDIIARGASSNARLAVGGANTVLKSDGTDPSWTAVTSLLDVLGSTQGQLLYRNASAWVALSPGTSGQFLKTQGAAADPIWDTATAAAGGADTQVQFNDGGATIGGDAGLTYNKTTDALSVAGTIELGHASDTTLSRTGAGDIAIEGNAVYRAGGTDVAVADGGTGASTAADAATNLGLGTGDSPQFTAVNIGHASDTTLARSAAGIVTVEGTVLLKGGVHTIWMPAGAMRARVTSGAATGTLDSGAADVTIPVLDFDQTSAEYAHFQIAMPLSWDEGTVTFIPYWTAGAGTATETMIFTLAGAAISNDDPLNATVGTPQSSSDALIATEDLHVGPESSAITISGTPAAGDLVAFQLARDISDTLAADARLIGIKILYTVDAANDA